MKDSYAGWHWNSWKDTVLFFYKFIRTPHLIGSLIPSSQALALRMMEPVNWHTLETIAELGAGTGVFTKHVMQYKRAESTFLIFEQDTDMRKRLLQQYPHAVMGEHAEHLLSAMQQYGISTLDVVISGLPFAIFSSKLIDDILDQVEQALKPDGLFIAFQYSVHMRKRLAQKFDIDHIRFVLPNIPPAFVYVCRKRSSLPLLIME
ncbi:class I SAM-dependent methyltransferase [Paenibacillus sp. 481]|uniref:class I SAM-dependent methyltransferase n=1 Tax=Paenibacillus sp. 481 TaxID=2835869 RepID=UPI001E40E9A4|nr:methyltransferase domain-containing protein [Paenibacillus sp. 481]UHA74818.1 methyltransferase domain-containing protein [Paenibacillus sp. 481]